MSDILQRLDVIERSLSRKASIDALTSVRDIVEDKLTGQDDAIAKLREDIGKLETNFNSLEDTFQSMSQLYTVLQDKLKTVNLPSDATYFIEEELLNRVNTTIRDIEEAKRTLTNLIQTAQRVINN